MIGRDCTAHLELQRCLPVCFEGGEVRKENLNVNCSDGVKRIDAEQEGTSALLQIQSILLDNHTCPIPQVPLIQAKNIEFGPDGLAIDLLPRATAQYCSTAQDSYCKYWTKTAGSWLLASMLGVYGRRTPTGPVLRHDILRLQRTVISSATGRECTITGCYTSSPRKLPPYRTVPRSCTRALMHPCLAWLGQVPFQPRTKTWWPVHILRLLPHGCTAALYRYYADFMQTMQRCRITCFLKEGSLQRLQGKRCGSSKAGIYNSLPRYI